MSQTRDQQRFTISEVAADQGRIQEFINGEAVTAVDESGRRRKKIFHFQITVCEFYFIFGELKWIFF